MLARAAGWHRQLMAIGARVAFGSQASSSPVGDGLVAADRSGAAHTRRGEAERPDEWGASRRNKLLHVPECNNGGGQRRIREPSACNHL
jgi:hypothetical protein